MREDVRAAIKDAVRRRNSTEVIKLIEHWYEFKCPAFVYAGPGHQSKHHCEQRHPHLLAEEHSDWRYEWKGTAILTDGKLTFNPRHYGGDCC